MPETQAAQIEAAFIEGWNANQQGWAQPESWRKSESRKIALRSEWPAKRKAPIMRAIRKKGMSPATYAHLCEAINKQPANLSNYVNHGWWPAYNFRDSVSSFLREPEEKLFLRQYKEKRPPQGKGGYA